VGGSNRLGLFGYRVAGAAVLNGGMYEELEANPATTTEALAVVVLASVAWGVGAAGRGGSDLPAIAIATGIAVILWMAWAMLAFQVGTRLLAGPRTHATWGELLRTTGFAASPGLLAILAPLSGARALVLTVSLIWMFAATVVALRHALDYGGLSRALAVCAVSATLVACVAGMLGLVWPRVVV